LLEPGEGEEAKKWTKPPDLVVIDGGRGHLTAALEEMRKDGVFGIPTVRSRRKRNLCSDRKRRFPLRLSSDSEALHILQHIRDEAPQVWNNIPQEPQGKECNRISAR